MIQIRPEIYNNKELFNEMFPEVQVLLYCDTCAKTFYLQRSRLRAKMIDGGVNFFCCKECYLTYHKTAKEFTCQHCNKIFTSHNFDNANLFCSRKCYNDSKYHTKITSGENHWNYNPDSASRGERNSPEYAKFRNGILKRDNYTCAECGHRGGKLVVHHIHAWRYYPELRFEEDNVITLCIPCHKKIHLYYGYITKEPMQCRNTKK